MKKRKYIVILAITAVICVITFVILYFTAGKREEPQVESFNYNHYSIFIENSLMERYNVGPINDKETAIINAEQVWEWRFDEDKFNDIKNNQQPYSVYYNSDKDMWLVRGHAGQNQAGDAYVVIGSDGKVYAAWLWKE